MEPPSPGIVTVLNQSGRRLRLSNVRRSVEHVLSEHDLGGQVNVLLTSDEHIRDLNRTYRKVDEPTDVLTFPSGGLNGVLGDIAISVEYAERQAHARKVSLSQELGFLAIHGALHLAGMNDETEEERRSMVAAMNVVAERMGLKPDLQWWSILHGEAS
jgi:probable rRNA maturation factor